MKKDIRKIDFKTLIKFVEDQSEEAFRAKQIYEWLWKKSVVDFDQMTNLPKSIRQLLQDHFIILPLTLHTCQKSYDNTIKFVFKLHDSHLVEGVLIPTATHLTACISSQVGCSLNCKFCATSYMKRQRNLETAEIYDQVVHINKQAQRIYGKSLTNIVYMGMGEPLLNYAHVLTSIMHITSSQGLGISPRRITVSTAGIAKMIRRLGEEKVKFNLALSLHAANDSKRNQIMPINDTNNLATLREALKYYFSQTKNLITYEYIVFSNFNDHIKDAKELYNFTRHLPSKVNIIEYNPIAETSFVNTSEDKLANFVAYLKEKQVNVHIRRSRGKDIDAACGQLANRI